MNTTLLTVDGQKVLGRTMTELERRVYPDAMARSLNRVSKTVQTASIKDLAKVTGLKQQAARRRIVISKPATRTDHVAAVTVTGKPLNLIHFGAREMKRGGVTAKPWNRRQRFDEAFIRTMPNGATIVVRRDKSGKKIKSGPNKGSPALIAMWGPGVAKEAAEPAVERARRKVIATRMPIELERELRFRVSKLK